MPKPKLHRISAYCISTKSAIVLACLLGTGLLLPYQPSAASDLDLAATPSLGRVASKSEISRWDSTIFPTGKGLPPGSGNVSQGEILYNQLCSSCHGRRGMGSLAEELAGGEGRLTDRYPDKTIGLYWPFATTLFDTIRRSMPMTAPGSLKANEVYALTAYLLALNNIINADTELNATTLLKIQMPNQYGFVNIDVD